jgi:hypothetical protein
VNFFDLNCQEEPRTEAEFGIKDGDIAYTTLEDPETWIAKVHNQSDLPITLTAIDGCVILGGELEGVRRCDCMLTTPDHLYLIELKDENKGWKSGAIAQLVSTIKLFIETHGKGNYKHRKAFACNRQFRRFQEVEHELNLRVFREYGFRIDAQATIVVI